LRAVTAEAWRIFIMPNFFDASKCTPAAPETEVSIYDMFKNKLTIIAGLDARGQSDMYPEIRGAIKYAFHFSHDLTTEQFSELNTMMGKYGDMSGLF
jgi:hypothetical protein